MSKSTWLIIIAGVVTGSAVGFFTNWNPLATIASVIQNPTTLLSLPQTIWQTAQQHLGTILGAFSGVMGTLALATKAVSNYKQRSQETIQSVQTQAAVTQTQLQGEVDKLKSEAETQQQTITELKAELAKTDEIKNELQTTKQQLAGVITDRNRLEKANKELTELAKVIRVEHTAP
jgi:DNA repair exonuclease SbcCD ATPase subunit